jgi:hypothetical protein
VPGSGPTTPAVSHFPGSLGPAVDAFRATLSDAIRKGGSTLRDYVDSRGEPGYFQLEYGVYDRAGLPCRRCGTGDPRDPAGRPRNLLLPELSALREDRAPARSMLDSSAEKPPTNGSPLQIFAMPAPRELATRFEAYGNWRTRLAGAVAGLHNWLREHELADAQVDFKIEEVQERLRHDRIVVAFVAEYSRGKSELINAIFFADFGARLLPAAAGTHDDVSPRAAVRSSAAPVSAALPIETRLKDETIDAFRTFADEWTTFPLDLSDAAGMSAVLTRHFGGEARTGSTRPRARPREDTQAGFRRRRRWPEDDRVDVPSWRHAIINFPHPLLQQGLVILDTPGLNAIGAEPELTLNLLPSAHVILFVLAADAGVTKSDLDVWLRDLSGDDPAQRTARLVVLNKVDSLWDELKPDAAVAAEIRRQVEASATLLASPDAGLSRVGAERAARERSMAMTRCSQRAACSRSRTRCRRSSFRRSATSWARQRLGDRRARRRRLAVLDARQASIADSSPTFANCTARTRTWSRT